MELFKRAYAWGKERKARLGVFGNALGASGALIVLALTFGTPAIAHAGLFTSVIDWVSDNTLGFVFKVIAYLILSFSDLILYLVGWLFDLVVNYTVFGFGKYFSVSQGLIDAWGVLRDIANIALIFGFVMIGIATMLDIHGYEVKKTLPRLIIFAVLLNFSLLASEVIIDTSNVFASVMYSQSGAGGNCTGAKTAGGEGGDACGTASISGKILSMGGVFSIFNTEGGASGTLGSDGAPVTQNGELAAGASAFASNTQKGMTYLGLAIFVTIAAVVLLAGAIMLIVRAVVLTFLMVLSPIGFAGLAVPPLERYASMWWEKILSQSFFAPVYLLLILISLKIGEGIQTGLGGGANFEHALMADAASGGSIVILLVFALMIGFMVASLMVAKQMGAMGADFAMSASRRVVNGAWAPGRYLSAWAGRKTASAGGGYLERKYNQAIAAGDARGSFGVKALRGLGIDEGISAGLAKVKNIKIEGKSQADRDKEYKHRTHELEAAANQKNLVDNVTVLAAANKEVESAANEEAKQMATEKKTAAEKKIGDLIQKMSNDDIKTSIERGDKDVVEAVGKVLSPEKFEKLIANKDLTQDKKHELQHGRFGGLNVESQEVLDNAKNMKQKDLELLAEADTTKFNALVEKTNPNTGKSYLTDDQLESLQKSNALSSSQTANARLNTAAGRVERWINGNDEERRTAAFMAGNMTAKQKVKLKTQVLLNTSITDTFNGSDMNSLAVETKLNPSEMKQVREYILSKPANDPQRIAIRESLANNKLAKSLWNWPE